MKIAKIKINQDLDHIKLDVDQNNNGHWGNVCRWAISGLNQDQKNSLINTAKVALYDETWRLAEMGYIVQVIPYIN